MDATRLHQKVRIPGVLEISLLGSPAICQIGERVPRLERHPQKLALLAYLCTQPAGRTTSRDTLLGLFWPEAATAQARRGLSQALHFLTSQLGEVVERTGSQRLA